MARRGRGGSLGGVPTLRLHALVTTTLIAGVVATQAAPSYSREVRPILSEHCFQCHGPDDAAREADLRLDAPGHGRGQELLERIASSDRDEVMPPPHTGKSLSREQAATLRAWVAAGAPYETHWAFVRPSRPALPGATEDAAHPVDRFVRAKLAAEGLTPAPEADRVTLARPRPDRAAADACRGRRVPGR